MATGMSSGAKDSEFIETRVQRLLALWRGALGA